MPARQGRQRRRNAGNDNSAMLAMMPATCGQGRQRNAGKDASAALAGPSKAKLLCCNARDGNKAIGIDEWMARTPHTPRLQQAGQTPVCK
jgi:hypothetical protein